MAGYMCELCSGEESAVLLITPLSGGETIAYGADCMPIALTGMLAANLGIDADKLWAAAERLVKARDREAGKQAGQDQAAVTPDDNPTPQDWANGLCELHCREDRCGPNGERCSCPGHHGAKHTPQRASIPAQDPPGDSQRPAARHRQRTDGAIVVPAAGGPGEDGEGG